MFAFTPYQLASIAQSLVCLTADTGGFKFESQVDHITFVEIDHEIIAMVIDHEIIGMVIHHEIIAMVIDHEIIGMVIHHEIIAMVILSVR